MVHVLLYASHLLVLNYKVLEGIENLRDFFLQLDKLEVGDYLVITLLRLNLLDCEVIPEDERLVEVLSLLD